MKKFKYFYTITLILTLVVMSFGASYAYFAARITSEEKAVKAGSKSFSLNLSVLPKYPSIDEPQYTIIPMKDNLAKKAYENKCIDKNKAGACLAYDIKVFEYSDDLEYVTGSINITTSNVTNLSYMILDEEGNVLTLREDEEKNKIEHDKIISETEMTLGEDSFYIKDKTELNLVLLIWLSDTGEKQNEIDIGTFYGSVTFKAGKGGQITGNISSSILGTYTG